MPHRGILFAISLFVTIPVVRADIAIPSPSVDRIAAADAIVVGRVIAIEPQDADVPISRGGKETVKYRVAVVNVTEVILGKKETKMLRVGFVPINEKQPIRRYPPFTFKLVQGQHGLMFLRKHPAGDIYVGRMNYDFVAYQDAKVPQPPVLQFGVGPYKYELEQARRIAKMLSDPLPALKSKDRAERYLAATNLLVRYRTPKSPRGKTTPIALEESHLILAAILEQDWNVNGSRPAGWQLFNLLGLTEKDGWKAPRQINNQNDLRAAAQAWQREHGNYRIPSFVAE